MAPARSFTPIPADLEGPNIPQTPRPFEPTQPSFRPQDIIMDEAERPPPKPPTLDKPRDDGNNAGRQPRQTELQSRVNNSVTLKKVLGSQVSTLTLEELLGSSKELSQQMAELLKPRTAKPPDRAPSPFRTFTAECDSDPAPLDEDSVRTWAAAVFTPQTRGTLIKI